MAILYKVVIINERVYGPLGNRHYEPLEPVTPATPPPGLTTIHTNYQNLTPDMDVGKGVGC